VITSQGCHADVVGETRVALRHIYRLELTTYVEVLCMYN